MGEFTVEEWEVLKDRLAVAVSSDPFLWLTRLSALLDDAAREAKGRCDPHMATYLWDVQEKMDRAVDEYGR